MDICAVSLLPRGRYIIIGKPNNIPFDSAPKNICFYTYCKLKVKKWILRGVVWVRIVSGASAEARAYPREGPKTRFSLMNRMGSRTGRKAKREGWDARKCIWIISACIHLGEATQ